MKNEKKIFGAVVLAVIIGFCAVSCDWLFDETGHHHASSYSGWHSDADGHWRECDECSEKYNAASHQWGWVITVPPTETKTGLKTETCNVCQAESGNTDVIPEGTPDPTDPGDMRAPYYYPGTGITYNGFTGTEGSLKIGSAVEITYPSQTTFSADGFFTIEGSVTNSISYNHALIRLIKDSDTTLTSSYLVRNNFKQRIWLRFGSGAYTIEIRNIVAITSGGFDLNGDGDFVGGYTYNPGITFKVTNTRNEDGMFIYPSAVAQSDNPVVTGLSAELTNGKTNNEARIKAIHDYIVANTVYDQISFKLAGQRKKQDALTVLGTRYHLDAQYNPGGHFLAVCEGYANTFSALARAAGIQVKYVSSSSIGHAWNNVLVDGVWKFLDVTWDDPTKSESSATNVVDWGPNYVRYNYYLLNTMNGLGEHTGGSEDKGRSVIGIPSTPWQLGMPDGWY